jgi:hypothetical protein
MNEALTKLGLFVMLIVLKFENPMPSIGIIKPLSIWPLLFSSWKIFTAYLPIGISTNVIVDDPFTIFAFNIL